MKDKILQQISDKFAKTNGGITLPQLKELNPSIEYQDLKSTLNLLFHEQKIKIRQGLNLPLVYIKNAKNEK